jgi:hypothetical protein
MHPWRIAASLLFLGWIAVVFSAADAGVFHNWPSWTSWLIAGTLGLSILCFVVLLLNGIGVISTDLMASVGQDRAPTAEVWMAVYIGSMVVLLGINLLLVTIFHVDWLRGCLAEGGVWFLLASSRRPWWLFGTIRRAGWFAFIESDTTMRWLLGVIGMGLLLVELFAPVHAPA